MGTTRSDGGEAPYDVTSIVPSGKLPHVMSQASVPTTRRDNGDAGTDTTYSIETATVVKL
jgi:hypothetical protein